MFESLKIALFVCKVLGVFHNGMGSDQVKIACSHGRSNTLRFATFGDVSNVLSSFLLSMSTGQDGQSQGYF